MRNKNSSFMVLIALSLAALLSGCGSSNKAGDTGSVATVTEGSCVHCHSATLDHTSGEGIIKEYVTGSHNPNNSEHASGCQGCHGGGSLHNGVGPFEWPDPLAGGRCIQCHLPQYSGGKDLTGLFEKAKTDGFVKTCAPCHTDSGAGSVHAANLPNKDDCIGCHDVGLKAPAHGANGIVDDNNGVRAIVNEFGKWSHHVTGVNLQNAHCAACHLEGKVEDGKIIVDSSKHMADANTHLRNADTDADMQWDPAAPSHTTMDNFCMSCHDANGATSPTSVVIQAFINANGLAAPGKTASAGNPFGDTISNRYDKMQRPAVVDAKGQFATTNASHHAVLGKKYSGRTRDASKGALVPGTFANNSSAVLFGSRTTIFDAGKFESTYVTLADAAGETGTRNGGTTLGDDSTLHCGDCHTVGQYRQADVNVKPYNKAVIGAHGSNNEYLLRNSIGTDERHVGATYSGSYPNIVKTNTDKPYLVCFMCHKDNYYNDLNGDAAKHGHANEYVTAERCNGPVNTITFIGYTTANGGDEPYAFRLGLGQTDIAGSTKDTDFSNLFGIQCANCHNSGPDNAFGGIHGSKINVYTDANGAQQKPVRFMPGLGNTMYIPGNALKTKDGIGSVSDLNWEVKVTGTAYNTAKTEVIENGGCYTLVPEEGPDADPTKPLQTQPQTAPYSYSPAYEQTMGANAAVKPNNKMLFGEWGGCDDHRGNAHGKAFSTGTVQGKTTAGVDSGWINPTDGTVNTGGAGVIRKVLRPVSY